MEQFINFKMVAEEDIPKIPLYMDQVTGYLDEVFTDLKRQTDEKILTKTMINNYVKAGLLESPEKKKYNQDQIKTLMMIYMLKSTVQINEIDAILKYYGDNSGLYHEFVAMESALRSQLSIDASEDRLTEILKLLLSANMQKKYAELLLDELTNIAE